MTTIVPEYHTTIKYEDNTYYVRPFIISDKDFFLETWADFPTEVINPNPERLFEKRINMWLTRLNSPNKGYLPIVEGVPNHTNAIYFKNGSPCAIQYADLVWEEEGLVSKNYAVAVHPSFRGQGLMHIINSVDQYWCATDTSQLPVKRTEFEIYHNNTRALQVAKDREHTHTGSRRANTFGAVNTSVLMHKFDVSPPGQIDAPEAIFEVNLHEYEFTNDRYGTEYVTSGRRALKISRTTQQWDHNL